MRKHVRKRLADAVALHHDRRSLMDAIAAILREEFGARWAGLYEIVWHDRTVRLIAASGDTQPEFPEFRIGVGLTSEAIVTRAPVNAPDVRIRSRYVTTFPSTRSELIVPIIQNDDVVGTIDLESERAAAFNREDEQTLSEAAAAIRSLWTA